MMYWLCLTLCLILCSLPGLWAAEPPPEPPAELPQLLQDLDSPQRSVRASAELRLRDFGPNLLPHLPPEQNLKSPQVRQSLERIRQALDRQAARESLLASRLDVQGELTLAELARQIEDQTGNAIDLSNLSEAARQQQITCNLRDVPFWDGLQTIAKQAGVTLEVPAVRPVIQWLPETSVKHPAAVSGPFRVLVSHVQLKPLERGQLLRLTVQVAIEPRLRGLFLLWRMREIQLQSALGLNLAPRSPEAQYDLPLGEGGRSVQFQLDFEVPPDVTLQQLQDLRLTGKMRMEIAARNERIRFSDIGTALGARRRRAHVSVTFQSVEPVEEQAAAADGTTLALQLVIAYDQSGPAFESHRIWLLHNQIYLEDEQGQTWEPSGPLRTDLQGDGLTEITYQFAGVPADWQHLSCVYVAPVLIAELPFEFSVAHLQVAARDQ